MITTVTRGYSSVAPNELAVVCRRRGYVPGSERGVFVFHGAGGTAREPLTLPYSSGWGGEGMMKLIAERGRPIISADFNGLAPWANDPTMNKIGAAYNYFRIGGVGPAEERLFSNDPIDLVGASMGAATAIRWMTTGAGQLNGQKLALLIPALDWGFLYDNFAQHKTNMDASWGSRAAAVAQQPLAIASQIPNVPVKIWYAADDTVYPPGQALATVEAFADQLAGPVELVSLGNVGHTVQAADAKEIADFIYS